MSQNKITFLSALHSAQAVKCNGAFYTNAGSGSLDDIVLDLQGDITLILDDHMHGVSYQFAALDITYAFFSTVLNCWRVVDTHRNTLSLTLLNFTPITDTQTEK